MNTEFIDCLSCTWMLQGVREHVRFLLARHPAFLSFLLVCPKALPGQSPPPVKERASSQVHIRPPTTKLVKPTMSRASTNTYRASAASSSLSSSPSLASPGALS